MEELQKNVVQETYKKKVKNSLASVGLLGLFTLPIIAEVVKFNRQIDNIDYTAKMNRIIDWGIDDADNMDTDGDLVPDRIEQKYGTKIGHVDSDEDGVHDGNEYLRVLIEGDLGYEVIDWIPLDTDGNGLYDVLQEDHSPHYMEIFDFLN